MLWLLLLLQTRDDDLRDCFGKFGPLADARIVMDRDSGRPKGFAFITFENPADADAALKDLNGQDLLGRPMRVDKSTPKGSGPRSN